MARKFNRCVSGVLLDASEEGKLACVCLDLRVARKEGTVVPSS